MGERHLELELDPESSSPQIARNALTRLDGITPELLDKAQLITSELITNGLRHGDTETGAPIRFSARLHPSFLRIEVANPAAAASRPAMQPRGQLRSSGYGLIIVDALADRWGSDVGDDVRVWCELDHETAPAGAATTLPSVGCRAS
jgi:anti-sigma regulatory factor (Ser/Thr protein kinase)